MDPSTQLFVDEFGRARFFHGVNVVYKIPPWIPERDIFDPDLSLCTEDIENLQKWGFNLVRLGKSQLFIAITV